MVAKSQVNSKVWVSPRFRISLWKQIKVHNDFITTTDNLVLFSGNNVKCWMAFWLPIRVRARELEAHAERFHLLD
jgi:hypothetical protein